MFRFYSFGILLYGLAIRIAGLVNEKAALWVRGRKALFQQLINALGDPALRRDERRLAWFHCASLGEFEQGRPLMEAFRKQYPDIIILLTFFSPSGFENRKTYTGADLIFYLPLDTRRNARRFVNLVSPDVAFFVKYEFWFNYLTVLQERSTPHYLVSGIFRPDQHFFKWYGDWPRRVLKGFTHIFVQNRTSRELLEFVGIDQVSVTGDTRFDRVAEIASLHKEFPLISLFSQGSPVIVAGSTWPPDDEFFIRFFQEYSGSLRLILAPHEIREESIMALQNRFGSNAVRNSQLTEATAAEARVLIIDSIGMLAHLYRFGQIAYIGGGFGAGIHNTLEAAVFGVPVVFGPNHGKFHEALELVAHGGGFPVRQYAEFDEIMRKFLADKEFLAKASAAAKEYVASHTGATSTILSTIGNADR